MDSLDPMKQFKALMIGLLVAIEVFLCFVIVMVPLNIMFDYVDGKNIKAYFTLDFVVFFISNPMVFGVFLILVILSCVNQILKLRRENT